MTLRGAPVGTAVVEIENRHDGKNDLLNSRCLSDIAQVHSLISFLT